MAFLHLYMGYVPPVSLPRIPFPHALTVQLFVQSITTLKGVLESNEAKLHIWNSKPEGELARPFKAAPGFLEQLTGAQSGPQTDAAAIKEAEKPSKKTN